VKYRVLIVDGSAFMRQFLRDILEASSDFAVIGAIGDPERAMRMITEESISVVALDLDFRCSDGSLFYTKLRSTEGLAVIGFSNREMSREAQAQLASFGIVDIIVKPSVGYKETLVTRAEEIRRRFMAAIQSRKDTKTTSRERPQKDLSSPGAERLIVIGASTGGTIALDSIFQRLKPNLPGIIVVQHMPAPYTADFAKTLERAGKLRVREAADGDRIVAGTALVVPGGKSLAIVRDRDGRLAVRVGPRDPQSVYNPSIDYTFLSAAEVVGPEAMGVILTGMGNDGAKGLRALYDRGAYTIAQDESSSVVYGMPCKAVELGGVCKVMGLTAIADEINRWGTIENCNLTI